VVTPKTLILLILSAAVVLGPWVIYRSLRLGYFWTSDVRHGYWPTKIQRSENPTGFWGTLFIIAAITAGCAAIAVYVWQHGYPN
jgi:hypothetical protein